MTREGATARARSRPACAPGAGLMLALTNQMDICD
jgi:hypothetical protein